jgi:hypothetical protein
VSFPPPHHAAAAPAPAAAAADGRRNPDSPYGLPWSANEPSRGVVATAVHLVFRLFELVVFLALVPVRVLGLAVGRGLPALLRLPFQILGLSFKLVGYLVVAVVLLLVLVSVISMVTSVAPV